MHSKSLAAAAFVASAALFNTPAFAQSADDITALRRDIETLRQEYESRIADLEARLAAAETEATAAHAAADAAQAAVDASAADTILLADQTPADTAPPVSTVSAGANPNIYNPGISVALNGFFTAARHDTGDETIAGFALGDETGRPPRGFSAGETEVSFAANIDPFLAAFMAFSLGNEGEAEVEEAYIRTTALPGGLTLKAGRFLSGIGYLNERHAHDWSFADAPLPYRAFLGSQLGDMGLQVRWIAPTSQYLEFGAEALQGESFPASGSENNGIGAYSLFARTGSDLGVSSSYLASISYLHTDALDRDSGGDLFSGESNLGIVSLVYKWAPGGNPLVRNLTLVGEYFYGADEGEFNGAPLEQSHSGWYAQALYQFRPQWSVGLRYSQLYSEDAGAAFIGSVLDDGGHDPFDITALLEYDTSEFGRIRLQYARDESSIDPNDVLTLQYTVIYGPHGAHRY